MMKKLAFFVTALALTSTPPVHAQTAKGTFTAEPGGTISPKVAAAYVVRDQFNPRQTEIEVVLSPAPVDVASAAADLVPHQAVINDPALRDNDYVLVWVRSDGSVSMNATFGKTMTQFLDRTSKGGTLKAEITANTPEKVAARIFTEKPVKTMNGSSYRVDLAFSAPVTRPPAGKTLPPRGGEPGKALTAFLEARQRKEWPALKAALSPAMTRMLVKSYQDDQENLSDSLDTLNVWLPVKETKITGGTLIGEAAVLDVEGVMASGVGTLTLVRMIQGPSGWLFDRAAMAGMLP
jgi:hypothetical protein